MPLKIHIVAFGVEKLWGSKVLHSTPNPFLSSPLPSGFAFVYMNDKRDAEDAIRKLDDTEFGEGYGLG